MANRRWDQRPGLSQSPNEATDPYGADRTSNPTTIKWDQRPKIDPMDDDKTGPLRPEKKGKP